MTFDSLLIHLLNGLSQGMLLFLIAVGLSLIFGVMGILNFAHGALYMVGAYLTFQVAVTMGMNYWLAMVIAPLLVAAIGVFMETVFLRRVYSRDVSTQLLLTFAFILIFNDLVRMIWGSGPRTVPPPEILSGSVMIMGRAYPVYNLFIILVAPLVGLALWFALTRTRAGGIVRAAAEDRHMAGLLGINVPWVYTAVFAVGSWLAATGGVLAAPLRTISPAMGDNVIIESFIVAVVGGLGSFPGAFIGALILGLLNAFGIIIAQRWQIAFPFLLMAIILLWRPQGLFGEKR